MAGIWRSWFDLYSHGSSGCIIILAFRFVLIQVGLHELQIYTAIDESYHMVCRLWRRMFFLFLFSCYDQRMLESTMKQYMWTWWDGRYVVCFCYVDVVSNGYLLFLLPFIVAVTGTVGIPCFIRNDNPIDSLLRAFKLSLAIPVLSCRLGWLAIWSIFQWISRKKFLQQERFSLSLAFLGQLYSVFSSALI